MIVFIIQICKSFLGCTQLTLCNDDSIPLNQTALNSGKTVMSSTATDSAVPVSAIKQQSSVSDTDMDSIHDDSSTASAVKFQLPVCTHGNEHEIPPSNAPSHIEPQHASYVEGSSSDDYISKSVSASLSPVASSLTNDGNFLPLSPPLVDPSGKEYPILSTNIPQYVSHIEGSSSNDFDCKAVTTSSALAHTGVPSSVKIAASESMSVLKLSNRALNTPKKLFKMMKATKKQKCRRLKSVTLKKVFVPTNENQQKLALSASHLRSKRSDSSLSLGHGSTLSSDRSGQTSGTAQSNEIPLAMSQLDNMERVISVDDNLLRSSTAQLQSDVPISTTSTSAMQQNFAATDAELHASAVPPAVNLPTSQLNQVSASILREFQDFAITDTADEDPTGKSTKLS